jgi:class 3 adenylate cyclase
MAHKSAQPSTEFHSQIDEFLDALGGPTDTDRALATILFTDIVRSTELVASLGDRDWRELLESHNVIARAIINRNRGRLVKSTGDGLLATFDGPGRAIRCATALGEALRPLGIEIRAGLHTGEVEVTGDDLAGIGVHIAARILDAAGEGEVLVSAAIPMLVAGSGFEFDDRGERQFKGVPGSWRLFAVTS